MIHIGDVILPDGRSVHGRLVSSYEWDTGATTVVDLRLEWTGGDELTGDEYNEDLGGAYLHDYVSDALLLLPGEPEDYD